MVDIEKLVERYNASLDSEEKKAWFMLGVAYDIAVATYKNDNTIDAETKKHTLKERKDKYTRSAVRFDEKTFTDIFLHAHEIFQRHFSGTDEDEEEFNSIISEAFTLHGRQEKYKLSRTEAQLDFLLGTSAIRVFGSGT
jgi:ribulose kinase